MAHTLCFSGMDRAEEAKLKLLFADANEWLGGEWTLAPENSAEVLVIDLESMYGHMTWLKVHNSGRYIIALTSRTESEAEHLLLRPVTVESLVAALSAATPHVRPARIHRRPRQQARTSPNRRNHRKRMHHKRKLSLRAKHRELPSRFRAPRPPASMLLLRRWLRLPQHPLRSRPPHRHEPPSPVSTPPLLPRLRHRNRHTSQHRQRSRVSR
jgi:hypothetical protein